MGCRNRGLLEEESAFSASLSDALLLTTMCIVGLPVDVHVKDGSIYSGIFHTACVENNYGIVLKRARMVRKGNSDTHVANRGVTETLVVLSEDLVQVVAKEVMLPADGIAGSVNGHDVGNVAGIVPSLGCAERDAKIRENSKSNLERNQISQTRRSAQIEDGVARSFAPSAECHSSTKQEVENGKSDGMHLKEEASNAPVNERQVGDGRLDGKRGDYEDISVSQKEETVCWDKHKTREVQGTSSSLGECIVQLNAAEDHTKKPSNLLPKGASCDSPVPSIAKLDSQCHGRHASEDFPCSDTISSGVSASVSSPVEITSESHFTLSSSLTEIAPPKSSSSNRTTKDFKLNPGAKIFCPSFPSHRSTTPPALPMVTSVTYMPDNCPVVPIAATESEVEINPFAPRSSLPVKFVPYGNLITGSGGSDSQYPQPLVGHVGSRTPPVRYAGQYHSLQGSPAYVHPNSLNVMVGRLGGQLVYVHPVSHDVTQGAAALSQVSNRPLLTPHQVQLPKHQGLNTVNHGAAAQALQLCVTPSFVANGQQPYAVPSHIPLAQPPFPVIRPVSVPGSNGFLSSKFS